MGLKTMALAGAVLATMSMGVAAPAFAAAQAVSQVAPPHETPERTMAAFPGTSGQDDADDVSGLTHESPVCSALGAETIPTGGIVANCTSGTGIE